MTENIFVSPNNYHEQGNKINISASVRLKNPLKIDFNATKNNIITIDNDVLISSGIIEFKGNENKILIGTKCKLIGDFDIRMIGHKNTFLCGDGCTLNNSDFRFQSNSNTLHFSDFVRYSGHTIFAGVPGGKLTVGKKTTFQNVYFLVRNGYIHIGENCMFSREIEIRTSDVHKIYDLVTGDLLNQPDNVIIQDNVWVAAGVTISKGSQIPPGSVIGARSFVNKKFDLPNSIYAGVPAKFIRDGIRWER